MSADTTPFSYYADLNPRWGARYERRWAVFLRRSATETSQTHLRYASRKAAEKAAERLNAAEHDPHEEAAQEDLPEGSYRLVPEALVPLLLGTRTQGLPVLLHAQAQLLLADLLEEGVEVADVARDGAGVPWPLDLRAGDLMRWVVVRPRD